MIKATLALVAALFASSAHADTLIFNANGIQVGDDGRIERFRGLLIGDDGKVVRTYPLVALPTQAKQIVDAQGRTLVPGLIDAHGHVMGLGFAALQLDLTGTQSLQELQQRLRDYAAQNPNLPWITGRGWNQELWADKSFPTAADLDAIVADRPVLLNRIDGHAVVVNGAAMKAATVNASTMDVVGGKIERDANGNPTGLFIDNAISLVSNHVPAPTDRQRDLALAKAQQILLSHGLTAVADMGTSIADWETMRRAGTAGKLNLRIMSYAAGVEPLGTITKPTPWHYADRLQMGGVKLYADGALGSRGAFLKAPYADKPDTRGLQFHTDAKLLALADQAAARGFQVATHAIGDAGNAQVISTYEQLAQKYPGNNRWRIEHVQIVDPADIPRIAKGGIIASMQPTHQTSDRLMAEARLGPNRLAGAYAWQAMLRSGARLAFGSDFPVESPNPFPGLAAAISRQDIEGQPPGGWLPAERVTLEQALAGFTRDAAYAGFAEGKFGALDPGKWADFILIDRDPTQVDPQALARTQVLETWLAGRRVWKRSDSSAAQPERGK